MPLPSTAAAIPIPTAQKNSATFGVVNVGMSGTASEKSPKPVHEFSPMKMSEPTPAASRPGTSTTPSIAPPSPDTSMSRKAPVSGEPRSVLIAAKLPAAAITAVAVCGAFRRTRCTARTPIPLPMAMSGASGPSTAPQLRVAKAAMMMPGSSTGGTAPEGLNPSAGACPPVPGR